jgi:hypothetical protein
MKNVRILFYLVLFLVISNNAQSQEYDMEQALKLATPNENHQRLETDFGGKWNYSLTSDFEGMKMTGSGTSSNNLILGGRFLMMESQGEMFGQVVNSITIMGYDNAQEKYTMIGLDELGTYYITAAGTYDEVTKTYTLDGTYEEPVLKKIMDYRFIMDVSDPAMPVTRILFENEQGGMDEMMKLNYTR